MIGPGKYDHLCALARETALAEGAIVIILRGEHGSGFSVQVPPEVVPKLPNLLRRLADDIEREPEISILC